MEGLVSLFITSCLLIYFSGTTTTTVYSIGEDEFILNITQWSECSCGNYSSYGIQYPQKLACVNKTSNLETNIESCSTLITHQYSGSDMKQTSRTSLPMIRECKNFCESSLASGSSVKYLWKASGWSKCSEDTENKTRTISCIDTKGINVSVEFCLSYSVPRPVSTARCSLPVSDCIVGPLKWESCKPCSHNYYQIGTRDVITPPLNGGLECQLDLFTVRPCPEPKGSLCDYHWTQCKDFPRLDEKNKLSIPPDSTVGYSLMITNVSEIIDRKLWNSTFSSSFVSDVRLCHLHVSNSSIAEVCRQNITNSQLEMCNKCETYRWQYGEFGAPVNFLNGKLAIESNCGPYQQKRTAYCQCTYHSATGGNDVWQLRPNEECELHLKSAPKELIKQGVIECETSWGYCPVSEWTEWSSCVTFRPDRDLDQSSSLGLTMRTRSLLQLPQSSFCSAEPLPLADVRQCYGGNNSVTETILINTTYPDHFQHSSNATSQQNLFPKCGSVVTNCFANITFSNFKSGSFQTSVRSEFCEDTKEIQCGIDCIVSQWTSWSDWWIVPESDDNQLYTKTRQRKRYKQIVHFGRPKRNEHGKEVYVCDGREIPSTNNKLPLRFIDRQNVFVKKDKMFHFIPVSSTPCLPAAANNSTTAGAQFDKFWSVGSESLVYGWTLASPADPPKVEDLQYENLLELLKMRNPVTKNKCFLLNSQDCILTPWSLWFLKGSSLIRFRKVVSPKFGNGKECGQLLQYNTQKFAWKVEHTSTELNCIELSLSPQMDGNHSSNSSNKIVPSIPGMKCYERMDNGEIGNKVVNPLFCYGTELPPIQTYCHKSINITNYQPQQSYTAAQTHSLDHFNSLKTSRREKEVSPIVLTSSSTSHWEPWGSCFGCEMQMGAERFTGYQIRSSKNNHYSTQGFCHWILSNPWLKQKFFDKLEVGVDFEYKPCFLPQFQLFWPQPDIESVTKNCGDNIYKSLEYSNENLNKCFWRHHNPHGDPVEANTQMETCEGDLRPNDRFQLYHIPCDISQLSLPKSVFVPFQSKPSYESEPRTKSKFTIHAERKKDEWSAWDDNECVDTSYETCGSGVIHRFRTNAINYSTKTPLNRVPNDKDYLESRACSKKCNPCFSFDDDPDSIEMNRICAEKDQELDPALIAADCVSNWSPWSECIREEKQVETTYRFRTRYPPNGNDLATLSSCVGVQSRLVFIENSSCEPYQKEDSLIEFVLHRPSHCYLMGGERKMQVVDSLLKFQKCSCPEFYRPINSTCVLDRRWLTRELARRSSNHQFECPPLFKIISVTISLISFFVICVNCFLSIKIEVLLHKENISQFSNDESIDTTRMFPITFVERLFCREAKSSRELPPQKDSKTQPSSSSSLTTLLN